MPCRIHARNIALRVAVVGSVDAGHIVRSFPIGALIQGNGGVLWEIIFLVILQPHDHSL